MRRNRVTDTLCPNPLNIRTEIICAVILLWCILLRARWGGANAEDVSPLLKRFIVVLGRQRGVRRAVPEL